MIVAVTGATGDIGSALVERLLSLESVDGVVTLGRRVPASAERAGVRHVHWELGQRWPADAAGVVDALVHVAFVIEDTREQEAAFDANVTGTLRLVSSAAAAGVEHITFVSSANAYGLRSGPDALDESVPPTDAPSHFYLHHKFLCELALSGLAEVDARTTYAVARPCMVVGRGVSNTAISTLTAPTIVYPRPDHSSYQFITVEDVAEVLSLIVERRAGGTFNLAPEDSMTVREIAEYHGHRAVAVPLRVAEYASDLGFALRLTPYSSRWVTLGDPIMRGENTARTLGWRPRHTSREALRSAGIG